MHEQGEKLKQIKAKCMIKIKAKKKKRNECTEGSLLFVLGCIKKL